MHCHQDRNVSTSLHLIPNQASQESPWIPPVGSLRLQISNRVPARSEVESNLLARRQLFRGAGKQQQQQQQQQIWFQLSVYFGVEDSIKVSVPVSQTYVCIALALPNISIGSTCVFYIPCVCWHLLVFQSLSFVVPSAPLGRPSGVGLVFFSTNDWRRKKGLCEQNGDVWLCEAKLLSVLMYRKTMWSYVTGNFSPTACRCCKSRRVSHNSLTKFGSVHTKCVGCLGWHAT